MPRVVLSPGRFVSVFGLLLVFPGTLTQAQEKQPDQHRSPRATVRTLLTTMTVARNRPEVVQKAAACLDLSGLPASQRNNGVLLATQLEAVLRSRDVDTERLPEAPQGDVYVLPDETGQRIALQRMPDGAWLFDRETVAQIPRLYAEALKRLHDRNKEAAALNVAPEFASARATVRTFVNAYRRQDFDHILRCLDLSDLPNVARVQVGTQLANKLRQIILRQPRVILQEIPDSNFSDPYVWLSR